MSNSALLTSLVIAGEALGLLTGLAIAGEALALLIGMHLFNKDDPWLSPKNDLLSATDIITGLGLIAVLFLDRGAATPFLFVAFLTVALLTHLYREWQFIARASNPFCANTPLFIVNNLKLLGLLATAAVVFSAKLIHVP